MPSSKNDKSSSSSSSIQIKGGGRSVLTDDTEEALILLLMKCRGLAVPASQHDRQRECRRFVKRLVAQHEQHEAYKSVNGVEAQPRQVNDMATNPATDSSLLLAPSTAAPASVALPPVNGKVRIELVEVDFSKGTTSSSSTKQPFKGGTKKILVLPRATTVVELCQQAKAKLRLKKLPNYAFVTTTPKKGIQVPLEGDLRALKDGCTVYVATVQDTVNNASPPPPSLQDQQASKEAKNSSEDNGQDMAPDLLNAIKQAYRKRASSLLSSSSQKQRRFKPFTEESYPTIHDDDDDDDASQWLPRLSEEQAALPAASQRRQVLQAVKQHRVVIIRGATGSGKSTQIPQYLDQSMRMRMHDPQEAGNANILVTQPRRVAATALAHRVADEMASPRPGKSGSVVGYRVRLDHAVSDTCRITYCTIGILLRMLVCPPSPQHGAEEDSTSPPLQHLSHLVIDEVHERDLNTDFCLTLIRSVLRRNTTLRVVLMSATASSDLFADFFAAFDPHVIDIPGKMFPVEIKWLPDCERFVGRQLKGFISAQKDAIDQNEEEASSGEHRMRLSPRSSEKIDDDFVAKLIRSIIAKQDTEHSSSSGAVLVFLPGKAEIESLARKINGDNELKELCRTIRLHSTASKQEQESAFSKAPPGRTKVILATNIAETSITIPGKSSNWCVPSLLIAFD